MKRLSALVVSLTLVVAVPFAAPSLRAQQQDPPTSKQELARAKFQELTERMQKLHVELTKSDPDQGRVLGTGLQYIQEAKIQEEMAQVKQLLDKSEWDPALTQMQDVRKDLTKLLEILQNRNMDLQKLLEQLARLEKFRGKVDQLAKEQGKEKDASAKTEELQKQLAEINKAKERVEQLLQQQKDLREQTNKAGIAAAADTTQPLANKEGQLKEDTQKLAKDLAELEKKSADLNKEAPPAESKPGEAKPGEAKPGEAKPGESKPGSGSCSGSAGKAAGSMGQAQQKLGDKKTEPALKDQDQAIEQLQQTKKALEQMAEQAQRELLKLPFESQAKKQELTEHATDTLAKDMEKSEEKGDNGEGKATPGRKKVQQAVPKQKAAAGQLKEYVPAKKHQQDAKEDLEKARDELDEAIAQLRQQLQDEVLRALEERFTAMLAKQRDLSGRTKVLDRTRGTVLTADGSLPTALSEKIQEVGSGEFDLGAEAADAVKLLDEEGSTAVFPEIVTGLRDDLYGVAKELRGNATGKPVQQHQADIEDTLALLINALRRTIERGEGGGNCNCNGQPPLVPISAELKMIRYLQERVNKRTLAYENGVPVALRETDDAKSEAKDLSTKQSRVGELTRKLAVKLNKENSAEEGGNR
jgi:myosin heavy subunit